MKNIVYFMFLACFFGISHAQVGIGTTTPDSSSILDITADDKGILIPRMTESQRDMISAPVNGLLIYQTDNTPGFYYYDGSIWTSALGAKEINDLNDGLTISSSTYLGQNSGTNDDGTNNYNTGVGQLAFQNGTSGNDNTAIGYRSMRNTTTGSQNTAVGESALVANSTGNFNVAVGELALGSSTTASLNTAIGTRSLANNTTGSFNSAVGYTALYRNTIGTTNTAIGYSSLYENTEGSNNTAIGDNALRSLTTQSYNVAIGNRALQLSNPSGSVTKNTAVGGASFSQATTAVRNVGLGYYTGYRVTTGISNVAIGTEALEQNQTGSFNTAVGDGAGQNPSGTSVTNNTYLGYFSGRQYLGNNNILLGPSTGDSGSGDYNVYIGHNAGRSATGSNNVFLGRLAGDATTGSNTLMIENSNFVGIDNALVYGEFDNNIFRVNGEVQIGNPTGIGTGYRLPTTDGALDQILSTDGAGQMSFVNPPVAGATKIDELLDGKSDDDGSNNGSSVFLGINAGLADDSSDNQNVGIGFETLSATTAGNLNVAVGYQALSSNVSGLANVAVGHQALLNNTGTRNVAIGTSALLSNMGGDRNTASGYHAMRLNTTGEENVAIGHLALTSNSTGGNNAAFGADALTSMEDGFSNTGIGRAALRDNESGFSNTAVGSFAIDANIDGSNNTAVGFGSLGGNADGSDNTALGYNAGNDNINGSGNVFLGKDAGHNETGSNTLYIENTNADADNALIYGEFDNNILRTNGELQIGNPAATGYALPTNQGTANQVLTTAGDGTTSWAAANTSTPSILNVVTNNGASIASDNTWVLLAFNTESIDSNSEFNTTTSQFTAASDGYYQVHSRIGMLDNESIDVGIFVNAALVALSTRVASAGFGFSSLQIDEIVSLNTNDVVEIRVKSSSGSGANILSGTTPGYPRITSFQIHQLD